MPGQTAVDEYLAENYPHLPADGSCPRCADLLATVTLLGDEADRLATQRDLAQRVADALARDLLDTHIALTNAITERDCAHIEVAEALAREAS